ncbi:50s ribosomal protein l1 [Ophiostoma piceae UAMH 11346]|uniref:50s ribosomal protein l1 n=1 Tax=Ophiostoma piceae (strain UAMH 11346) TaxID=1262450 RepID=S3BTX6_OPHP1|nr:50s ribosomal protein l1 [Ophiostoma piceae UAMH 11346]
MASQRLCFASLAKATLQAAARPQLTTTVPRFLVPAFGQTRTAATKKEKKKPKHKAFRIYDKSKLDQFSLCDAMRYIRAVEVGRPPLGVTYDIAVKLRTNKDGAVLRDRIRLPYPCNSDFRIAVICKEDSVVATEARADGAVAVGEESLFAAIKAGDINFNRLLCHVDSVGALSKAGLGPVLGPHGLMPSVKTKTITNDIREQMRDMAGTDNYRERGGVVRMAIGQLHFTPEMISDNIKSFMTKIKQDIRAVERTTPKSVDEVVLSSTNGPGFSLSGSFAPTDETLTPAHLTSVM